MFTSPAVPLMPSTVAQAASPTPMPSSYGGGGASRVARKPSTRLLQRRDSPLSLLTSSQGFSDNAPMMQSIQVGDSSDDEAPQPLSLSKYAEEIIAHNAVSSPDRLHQHHPHQYTRGGAGTGGGPPKLRIMRNASGTAAGGSSGSSSANTPHVPATLTDSITPAPSLRIKRVPLRGAPVRRIRRTPQADSDDLPLPLPPSQDQENVPVMEMKKDSPATVAAASAQRDHYREQERRAIPLAPISANTPHRPAPPPPPPKMSVLETATAPGGASTTKEKKRRQAVKVNGKIYSLMGKIGKGGSSDVYKVMAENSKMFALKRVKLEDVDESAIKGYKGEIDLLRQLQDVERVVRLFDYEVDEEKQELKVVMDMGESDLQKLLRTKLECENAKLDLSFTRYYWKEMLECVEAIQAPPHNIVHSDLKPANFVLISGRLKLIDFGIANAINIDETLNVHRDSHVGTPNFMSPESLEDTNAGVRDDEGGRLKKDMRLGKPSDVWSLGCILYQMTYGRPPFGHIANQLQRVMAIVNPNTVIEYPLKGIGGVRIPAGLRNTLRHCLQRDPARRPTIEQLLDERDPFLYPDSGGLGGDDLRIPQDLLAQIIQRVADRFRDPNKAPPTDEEIRQYPASFYAKIRELLEEG